MRVNSGLQDDNAMIIKHFIEGVADSIPTWSTEFLAFPAISCMNDLLLCRKLRYWTVI
jgi:hypothetical protein